MINILKYLKHYWLQCLIAIAFLFVQAYCDLSLPAYTSDIVDTGIQNGGIASSTPKIINEKSLDELSVFIKKSEEDYILSHYKKQTGYNGSDIPIKKGDENDTVFVLNTENEAVLNTLDDIFSGAMIMTSALEKMDSKTFLSMAEGLGNKSTSEAKKDTSGKAVSSSAVPNQSTAPALNASPAVNAQAMQNMSKTQLEAMQKLQTYFDSKDFNAIEAIRLEEEAGMVSKDQIVIMRNKATEEYGSDMVNSMAITKVSSIYKSMGVDLESLQYNYLFSTGGLMLILALIMMVSSVCVGFIASKTAAGLGMDLRGRMFKKVISFSHSEMDKFSTASLITRSTNDVQQIQMVVVMFLRMIAYAPILGIGGIIKVLSTNVSMTWIIAVAVLAVLCVIFVLMVVAMPKFKIMQKLVDKLNLVSREILTGLSVIRAFSREEYEEKRFDYANKDLTRTQLFTNRVMTFMFPIMMLIMNAVTVLIIWVSAKNIDKGTLQVGQMTAFIQYTMQIVMSFLMITMISIMLPRAIVSANRVEEVFKTEPSIEDKKHTTHREITNGEIKFNNVSFIYPGANEEVLRNISFTASPGETVAFIGSTGSGKSTLINLVPRFYDISGGEILIDDVDIRDYKQSDLRKAIGYVPQKGMLFSGTIASNLRFGNENASDEEIKNAAEIAQATEFIDEKPDKYEDSIAQGGQNVSGGQKQRLSIARAIAKKPKIFIFDDSFSALDYKTDVTLRKALHDSVSDATVLIVAQRISTILHADRIVVLDEGEVAGIGTHDELLKSCDVYKQIALSQLSQKELEDNKGKEEK